MMSPAAACGIAAVISSGTVLTHYISGRRRQVLCVTVPNAAAACCGGRVALVERFAESEFGTGRPYQWAIHTCTASDGKEPHVHLMFSDRQQDGIERGPEKFFERLMPSTRSGGRPEVQLWVDKAEAARTYEWIRERWAKVQNLALEMCRGGGTGRSPEPGRPGHPSGTRLHRGPAVSGSEARGHVSEVGQRQREQVLARSQARSVIEEEVRTMTLEEVALERVAACERRDLAREVTGQIGTRYCPGWRPIDASN